jgi:hypothetical protein
VLVAYVSGHGFGHATRTAEVLKAVRRRAPEARLGVVSSAPEWLFRGVIPGTLDYRLLECDVGLAQKDALVIDEAGTLERWRAFAAGGVERVRQEALWLTEVGTQVVLGDIPPFAFAAAASAGLPSVGLGNFSWDWIYRHAARNAPGLLEAAEDAAAAYARASLLLRLPFSGDLSAFPRVEDIPLVARRPAVTKVEARRRLEMDSRPVVLVSFGGIGLPGFRPQVLAPLSAYQFLVPDVAPDLPGNVQTIDGPRLQALGLQYEDVVGAADIVVTKPGYGIVTDAIGAGTRLVYTDRGDFPEYPILVEGMKQWLATAYVTKAAVLEGQLEEPLGEVLATPMPSRPDLDGACVAARRILEVAGLRGA